MDYLYIVLGIILLLLGGDWLVKAAVDIALRAKISVLVVGLTVVSFATSAPELLVSLSAAYEGFSDISFGNVIGSNIANIALILGVTSMVFPMMVSRSTYRLHWWVMMAVTVLLFLFLLNGLLRHWEALVLFLLLIGYNVYQVRASRKSYVDDELNKKQPMKIAWMLFYLVIGVAGLRFGSDLLVEGSVNIATAWGVSERVIGVTIVSIGTSLPELSASLVASMRGEQELSLGNLVGSNIFNILAVLGITGLFVELPIKSENLLTYDFPWLFGICLLLYPLMRYFPEGKITRWQGFVMFVAYTLYILGVFFLK